MMQWHRPNRRKGRRLRLAAVESHLGDVIGAPLSPMRPVYRYEARRWIERGVPVVVAWIGVTAYAVIVGLYVLALFAVYPSTPFSVN